MSSAPPSLFEWAGWTPRNRADANAFHDRLHAEPMLSPLSPGGVSGAHRQHVSDWWFEAFGGPATYTDHHDGYEQRLAKHRGLGITPRPTLRLRVVHEPRR